jgi:arsenate reductase-like glutaredoxin family protein
MRPAGFDDGGAQLRGMVERLLEQTAVLPVLGEQIGTSLETFGDRLVDGLNEIFGNRLASMLDDFQRAVRNEIGDTQARLDLLQRRVEATAKAESAVADAMGAVRERLELLTDLEAPGATAAVDSDAVADAVADAVSGLTGELADEVGAVRRTVEKLDRAGVIRRKRIEQLRAATEQAAKAEAERTAELSAGLAAQKASIDELNSWIGMIHTELEDLRDTVTAVPEPEPEPEPEPIEPPPPVVVEAPAIPADIATWMSGILDELGEVRSTVEAAAEPDETDRQVAEELARLSAEFQLLRRRLPVRAKQASAGLDDEQIQRIADRVVQEILAAVDLESVDDDDVDDAWEQLGVERPK